MSAFLRTASSSCTCACTTRTPAATTTRSPGPLIRARASRSTEAPAGAYLSPTARDPHPTPAALRAGTLLAERVFGEDAAGNSKWTPLTGFTAGEGEIVGDLAYFKLVVAGIAGDDGNLFNVAVSLLENRATPVDGVELFTFSPTLRVPRAGVLAEMRFRIPTEASTVSVHSFDAAGADFGIETEFRSVPVQASGQSEWVEQGVPVDEDERGNVAALVFADGAELPNDGSFYVAGRNGEALPIALPLPLWERNGRPETSFASAVLADCTSVSFDASASADPDDDVLDFQWLFGDGGTGGGNAVVHRYARPGTYRAVLRVRDRSGLVGSGTETQFDVVVNQPPTPRAGGDVIAAPGQPVALDGSRSFDADGEIVSYEWDLGDGTIAQGATVNHGWGDPGLYTVTLRVEDDAVGACNAAVDSIRVRINVAPVAVAGEDRRVAVGETVSFDGTQSYDRDGAISSYVWDLGDEARREGSAVEYSYAAPGRYEVRLDVRDDAAVGNSSASDTFVVVVNSRPIAVAGADRRIAIGERIEFDAGESRDSDGEILGYVWDFGDGGSANGRRVTYAYPLPGTYVVSLRVRDDSGVSSDSSADSLRVVVNAPPVADAGQERRVLTASEVDFDATGSEDDDGLLARHLWDFGDGRTGEGPTPTHVYREPGKYRVRLTVADDSGTVRNAASDEIEVVINAAPVAVAVGPSIAAPDEVVSFTAAPSFDPDGDIVSYEWDFGDGEQSVGTDVLHTYGRPGTYTVRLTVRDDTGDTRGIDFAETSVIVNAPPHANGGADILAAPEQTILLNAVNSFDGDGQIVTYLWEFSDGSDPVEAPLATRSFSSPGTYTARLTVVDDSGASNHLDRDEVTIRVNHAPVPDPGGDVTTWRNTVGFDATRSGDGDGDALTYTWDFGDGTLPRTGPRVVHTYAAGGTHEATLTVDDGLELANSVRSAGKMVRIRRAPVAEAGDNRTVCAGDDVIFDGSLSSDPDGGLLSYTWAFDDGEAADGPQPSRVFRRGGVYPVTLTVASRDGAEGKSHSDRVLVRVAEAPIADAGADRRVCANTEVHFDGSRSHDADGVVNRFSWEFGDGSAGGGATPVHIFTEPGVYGVQLTVEGDQVGQCDYTHTDEAVITVVASPAARFLAPQSAPVGASVRFDGSPSTGASGTVVQWTWDFGDGATASGRDAVHTYERPGSYIITLIVRAEGGGADCQVVSTRQVITINGPPTAVAGDDMLVGVHEEVVFDASASSDTDGGVAGYRWEFGDGNAAEGVVVRHRYTDSGTYRVQLEVSDDTDLPNNSAQDSLLVLVNAPPGPVIEAAPTAACPGAEIAFSGAASADPDGGIAEYAWAFGNGNTAEGPLATQVFRSPGTYPVSLTVDDGRGVGNSRVESTLDLTVNRSPVAESGPDQRVCPSAVTTFDASASTDWDGTITRHTWNFDDSASAEGEIVDHTFSGPGTYSVRLRVEDDSASRCNAAEDLASVVVNATPVADAGPDRSAFFGGVYDDVLFDAGGSLDPDGDPLTYTWDFGDGTTATGSRSFHAYDRAGTFTVVLTVRDGTGLACGQATDTATITVRER